MFSRAPAKKATAYRNLQYRKVIGVFCTFIGHEAGEQFAILRTCESGGNSLPEVQAISGCVACVEFKKNNNFGLLLIITMHCQL